MRDTMNNDEWIKLNHPEFTENQIKKFKDLVQMYYGYEMQINAETANCERCRRLAAIGATRR